jgi:hypothetical protein
MTDRHFFGLCACCILAGFLVGGWGIACTPSSDAAATYDPGWRAVVPPRPGLRCWSTAPVGAETPFCEPDPSATHGAAP